MITNSDNAAKDITKLLLLFLSVVLLKSKISNPKSQILYYLNLLTLIFVMIINRQVLTLDEFTIQHYGNSHATGELSGLLRDIGLAAKRVNVEVNKAGLVDILGDAGQ